MLWPLIAAHLAAVAFSRPALPDDCAAAAKSAMLATAQKPVSTITTKTSAQGKQTVTRTVQTQTDKYVQLESGEWYAMGIAIKDLIDDTQSTKITCKRSGSGSILGQPAMFYEIEADAEGTIMESKIWVSSQNLILKSEGVQDNFHYTTVYDSSHVTPPAYAKRMGGN